MQSMQMSKMKIEEKEKFVNPIDPDKVAENPGIMPYAHTVGSAVIRPIDKGRIKGLAVSSMYEQTEMQMGQIREQVQLLIDQSEAIRRRVEISEKIYLADMSIKPLIGKTYHLYKKKDDKNVLSMIAPSEWGGRCPYEFEASVTLLSDHTWEVQE